MMAGHHKMGSCYAARRSARRLVGRLAAVAAPLLLVTVWLPAVAGASTRPAAPHDQPSSSSGGVIYDVAVNGGSPTCAQAAGGAQSFSTIAAALQCAQGDGTTPSSPDQIWVGAGTYHESYDQINADVNIYGANNTVVTGGGAPIFDIGASDVTFSGFTIEDGAANSWNFYSGGAITEDQGALTATYMTFLDNTSPSGVGGAVYLGGGQGSLSYDTFTGNSSPDGGAIALSGTTAGSTVISHNTFTSNSALDGGAIFSDNSSSFTSTGNTFSGNLANYSPGTTEGGAVYSYSMTSTNDTFSGNSADDGGAVYTPAGTNDLSSDTLSDNSASAGGGAIYNLGGADLLSDTFTANSAQTGSAIDSQDGVVSVYNSTLSGNDSSYSQGAIWDGAQSYYQDTYLYAGFDTIAGNTGGGLEVNDPQPASVSDTILAQNSGGDCGATSANFADGGYNVADDTTCPFSGGSGSVGGSSSINLGPLQANGGPTETIAIGPGSSAFELVPTAKCNPEASKQPSDQRGLPRPGVVGQNCDAGAFEFQPLAITSADATTFSSGNAGSFTVTTSGDGGTPSLNESGGLPSGVSFQDNGNGTANLSGTPDAGTAGTYPITITASNAQSPPANQSFTLTVNPGPGSSFYVGPGGTAATCAAATDSATPFSTISAALACTTSGGTTPSQPDTVYIAAGTYDETDTIAADVNLVGAGASTAVIDGTGSGTVLTIDDGLTVNISGLTVENGSGNPAGGILFPSGTLTLTNDTFSGNQGYFAGAIDEYAAGQLTATGDTFTGNSGADGGAIFTRGTTTTLTDDTFYGNSGTNGGALAVGGGTVTATDDTFAGNSASSAGAAIYNSGFGGGETGQVTIADSVLADSTAGQDCSGSVTDGGYNVDDDGSCQLSSSTGSLSDNPNIGLGPLQYNGGTTETAAIGTNSSAFELVPPANCTVATDQRGDPRPGVSGQNCDAGAYEYQAAAQTISWPGEPTAGRVGQKRTLSATGGGSGNPVVFSIDATSGKGACYVSGPDGTALRLTAGGTCVIDANQAGGNGYLPAPQVQDSFKVIRIAQTITFTSTPPKPALVNQTYDVTATGGASGEPVVFSSGTPSVCTVSGSTVSLVAVGTCVVVARQAGDAQYAPAMKKQGFYVKS
jgi:hypothetical protein